MRPGQDGADERRWKALASVAASHEGRILVDYLKSLREQRRDELESIADPVGIHQAQGRAKELSSLIKNLEEARGVVELRYR